MAAPPEDPKSGKRGLVEVGVAPKKSNESRWQKFKGWVLQIGAKPEARHAKETVEKYLNEATDAGLEHLRSPKYANEKTQAEIQNLLEQTRSERDENKRRGDRTDLELKKLAAEIRKTEAEAFKIEADTALRLVKEMEKRGLEIAIDFGKENRILVVDSQRLPPWQDEDTDPSLVRSEEEDVVDTKINLAKAYIELGDRRGARAILDEVFSEGTEAQREIALQLRERLDA